MNVAFSARLSELLNRESRSQKVICGEAGITEGALVNYKKGRIPKAPALLGLARVLGVTMEYLLTGEGPRNIHKSEMSNADTAKSCDVCEFELPPSVAGLCRRIPVIGWAHAGDLVEPRALPTDLLYAVPTECADPVAFAVRLEGDAMAPDFHAGEELVLMPGSAAYNGALAVVRLAAGGVLFRRLELRADRLVLVPSNPHYAREEFRNEEISWCYPVWGSWRQIWKR